MADRKRRIALVVHNVRSAHNVGSLLRTADGLAVDMVFLTGYTPYPAAPGDTRLPHVSRKAAASIAKTALGAEKSQDWRRIQNIQKCLAGLKDSGFVVAALEQTPEAHNVTAFRSGRDIALVVGSEIGGLDKEVLAAADIQLQIPMLGAKDSYNVSVAAAMAMYHLRYLDKNPA